MLQNRTKELRRVNFGRLQRVAVDVCKRINGLAFMIGGVGPFARLTQFFDNMRCQVRFAAATLAKYPEQF